MHGSVVYMVVCEDMNHWYAQAWWADLGLVEVPKATGWDWASLLEELECLGMWVYYT